MYRQIVMVLCINLVCAFSAQAADAPATTRPASLAELRQERLAVLRDLGSAAEKQYLSGQLGFRGVMDAQSKLLLAQADAASGDARIKLLQERVNLLRKYEEVAQVKYREGRAGMAMLLGAATAAEYERLDAEIDLETAIRRPVEQLKEARLVSARRGYEAVLEGFRDGRVGFMETCLWSSRLAVAQEAAAVTPDAKVAARADYLDRARKVEAMSQARFEAGMTGHTDMMIAKCMRVDAELRVTEADNQRDTASKLLAKLEEMAQAVLRRSEASHRAGESSLEQMREVQRLLLDSRILGLRAAGKADQVPPFLREQIALARRWEGLAAERVRHGLANSSELGRAAAHRLELEIRLAELEHK